MGETIGYARVSTASQNLDVQLAALTGAGCERIYKEKVTGASRSKRHELEKLMDYVREGDTLVVTKLDRLARSLPDLINIGEQLDAKSVALKVLDQPVDTITPAGRLFFSMLGAFAQFENEIRRERQMEGIAAAKQREDYPYKGRPASIDVDKINKLKAAGIGATAIAKELNISRQSVYRLGNSDT